MTISKAIDPARVGLSKSLMTGVCNRKSYYGDKVRDEHGRRLPFTVGESALFGKAIDVAHGHIIWHVREGEPWTVEGAIAEGLRDARADTESWTLLDDPETLEVQVGNAMRKFVDQPDGLARWIDIVPNCRIQGNDGESLRKDDVIGTPDYLLGDGSVLDVKSSKYNGGMFGYDQSTFMAKAEMPVYAFLAAAEFGAIPPRLIYQVYVRSADPRWVWVETPGTAAHVEMGRIYATHWRLAMASDNPDLLTFNTKWCGDCQFARPIPEVGFAGCAVGMLMSQEAAA